MECHHGLYAFAENIEREVFAGRVDGVTLQPKAHKYGLYSQHTLKVGYDGDAAAATYRQRTAAEGFFKGGFGRLVGRQRYGADVAFAAVERRCLHVDAIGGYSGNVVCEETRYFLMFLMRHESRGYFGKSFGGYDGLGEGPVIWREN